MASESIALAQSRMNSMTICVAGCEELHLSSSQAFVPAPTKGSDNRIDGSGMVRRIVHLAKHCGYGNGNVHVAVDLA